MNRLGLYLFRHLFVAFAFAAGVVAFVVLFTQSFRILSLVVDNAATMIIFFQLMALTIPTILPLVLPLGLGIAVLFVYHKLAMDSELVIMRAAGLDSLRLARPALLLALCVVTLCYVLTLWMTPTANRNLVAMQYQVRNSMSVFLSRPGSFNDITEGLTFFARHRGAGGTLEGILIHDVRKPEVPVTIMAETGRVITTNGEPQIVVFNGRRQELDPSNGHLSELAFDQYVLDISALRSSAPQRATDPREQTFWELLRTPATTLRTSKSSLAAELNQRLSLPLLAMAYTIVGLVALLCGEFNRRGMGRRMLAAGAAIIVIEACFMSLNSLVAKHENYIFALYALPVIPILVGLLALGRDGGQTHRIPAPHAGKR